MGCVGDGVYRGTQTRRVLSSDQQVHRGATLKVFGFTSHPERGWSVVTPVGAIIVEPGQQVTVIVSERWETTVIPAREETKPKVDVCPDLLPIGNKR